MTYGGLHTRPFRSRVPKPRETAQLPLSSPSASLSGLRAQRTARMGQLSKLEWRWERKPTDLDVLEQMAEAREVISDLERRIAEAEIARKAEGLAREASELLAGLGVEGGIH